MSAVSRRFLSHQQGSTAVIFALVLVPILASVGLAIDYASAVRVRVGLQKALDAAVLAGARIDIAESDRTSVFNAAFKDNYADTTAPLESSKFTYAAGVGATAEATVRMKATFMSLFGFSTWPVTAVSAANTDAMNFEIVLALDISGSMLWTDMGGGTRLDALKAAATKLIDTIMANKKASQSVKFAVVPFTMAVNIGTANAGIVSGTTNALFAGSTWGGCVLERRGNNFATDTYNPGATDGTGRWQAYIWPPSPNGGAASSCNNPSNGTNTSYRSIEAAPLGLDPSLQGPNFNCPRYSMSRLSTDDGAARAQIAGLKAYPNVGTTIGPAVGWGMRLLSPTGPFGDGAAFSSGLRKILVVVTDGELVTDGGSSCSGQNNTASAYRFDPASLQLDGRVLNSGPTNDSFTPYGYLLDSDPFGSGLINAKDADKELDRLAVSACSTAKARDTSNPIEIFTIAASKGAGPGTRAQTVLAACATDANHFIYAANSAGLDAAFSKIANQTLRLRLTQ